MRTSLQTAQHFLIPTLLLAGALQAPIHGDEPALRSKVESIVGPLIDAEYLVAATVGLIDASGEHVFGFGKLGAGGNRRPDGETVFEIGSITKVFTATILAAMVIDGAVSLDDPVWKLLPRSVKVPRRDKREITLADLAAHTSGLPRMPNNMTPRDPGNPYAGYTAKQMYDFLSGHELRRLPGTEYEYSNLGTGLLGHALALRGRKPYEALVLERVCEPCGMKSTRITLDDKMKRRLAPGHDADGEPASNWDLNVLEGAGALRSTANDMLRFASANLGLLKTPITAALESTHKVRHEKSGIALGWHWIQGGRTLFHNGGTGGYRSFLGLDKERKLAVVVLSNTAADVIDEAGTAILDVLRGAPVRLPSVRPMANVDSAVLDAYTGVYSLAPLVKITVTKESAKLKVQLTGQPKFRLYPETKEKFYLRVVDAQITFEKNDKGQVTGLVLHQNGRDQRAKRIGQAPPAGR